MELTGKAILDVAADRNQNPFYVAYAMRRGFSTIEEVREADGGNYEFLIWMDYAHRAIIKLEQGKKFYFYDRLMPFDESRTVEEFMELLATVQIDSYPKEVEK